MTGRVLAGRATILTSDPYVLATDLWKAPGPPLAADRAGRGTGRQIDPRMDYLGFRRGLFAAVAPYDQHLNDAGRAYALASGVFALAGLAEGGSAAPTPVPARAWRPRAASTV